MQSPSVSARDNFVPAPKVPCQPIAQLISGFPGMLSCRMSQQPQAEPGPAPVCPVPPQLRAAGAPMFPCTCLSPSGPVPSLLQIAPASSIITNSRGTCCTGGLTAVSPPHAEHRGCCGKHPAASWQQLLAEHKGPEAGGRGGPEGGWSFGCQSCSPPPTPCWRKGLLVAGPVCAPTAQRGAVSHPQSLVEQKKGRAEPEDPTGTPQPLGHGTHIHGALHTHPLLQGSGGETEAWIGVGWRRRCPRFWQRSPTPQIHLPSTKSQHPKELLRLPVCPVQTYSLQSNPKYPEHHQPELRGVGKDLPGGGSNSWTEPLMHRGTGAKGQKGSFPPPHQLKKQQQVLGLPGLFPAGEH